MTTFKQIQKHLKCFEYENSIRNYGVCDFKDLMPLFECSAKKRLPKSSKRVIVFIFPYLSETIENISEKRNISLYAAGYDYHLIILSILKKISKKLLTEYPTNHFEFFCDNSPINEVKAAALSGLGIVGCNSLLLTKEFGSFVFIGEIVTDLEISFDSLNEGKIKKCSCCEKCESECPTKAIRFNDNDDLIFEKEKCLSFITQKKQTLNESEINAIKFGGSVWGCDKCQMCCPFNQKINLSYIKEFYENINYIIDNDNYLLDYDKKAYNYRPKKIIERNIEILKNNR